MKKIILILPFLFLFSCLGGPAIKETYLNIEGNEEKKNALIYKLIIEGDNYDPFIKSTILEKVKIFLRSSGININVDDDVFKKDTDLINLKVKDEILNKENDYIIFIIIRTKNLGYSLLTLTDQNNIYLNVSLFDNKGKLIQTSLFTKVTSYPISAINKFHFDLYNVLNPIKSSITKNILIKSTENKKNKKEIKEGEKEDVIDDVIIEETPEEETELMIEENDEFINEDEINEDIIIDEEESKDEIELLDDDDIDEEE